MRVQRRSDDANAEIGVLRKCGGARGCLAGRQGFGARGEDTSKMRAAERDFITSGGGAALRLRFLVFPTAAYEWGPWGGGEPGYLKYHFSCFEGTPYVFTKEFTCV